MRRVPGGTRHSEWRQRAMHESAWLAAQPGLGEFARDLSATNVILREATSTRAGELLRGGVPVTRFLQVTFEVFTQVLALALDLRDTSRSTDADLRKWVVRRRTGASLPDSILARVEGGGELSPGHDTVSPYALATARRLRICLESLGPSFVKVGQLLGSAHGLLAEDVVAEFSRCHDEVKPHPAADIVAVVESDLGPLTGVFASFDPRPLASASIAQVHAAVLRSGQEVAVKVQRPGIRPRIESDVAILHRIARATENVDLIETLNLVSMTQLFCETVVEELDFRLEAENMIDLALAFEDAGHEGVCVPRPVPGLVTERVLVMERLHGARFGTAPGTSGADPAVLLGVGTQAVLEAALTYGVF
ncbi:MAG: AarF/ABC1/UbiB kinase family protein, partial [Acidimicrobiia bacterium]|nr:AarF/ABC1/UbiB kinase family protein [Acidimicrobiia bacterium]